MVRIETTLPSRSADVLAVVFALVFPTALTYLYFIWLADAPKLTQHSVYGTLKIIQFGFPICWFVLVQRRKLDIHPPRPRGVVAGIGFGLLVALSMWALYKYWLLPAGYMDVATQPIRDKIHGFGVDTQPTYLSLAIFYSAVHSFLEEYYWRWFVFGQLRRLTNRPVAVTISSLGFMAHHVLLLGTFFGWSSPLTWIFSISIAIGGAVWALFYDAWQSLYPVWISHLLVDAAIFWIGYDMLRDLFG